VTAELALYRTYEADNNKRFADMSRVLRYRPDLVDAIHAGSGPQCTQCGRRFKTDEEGRKKKTAHMDWHFRVNQRSAEAERRGQHRSWCVTPDVS
jgi:pre-mRNA cleavage complex 2 protein Pcf11